MVCVDEGLLPSYCGECRGQKKIGKHCSSFFYISSFFYPCISRDLPISSSSDVMDLERRAIAGVLSLLLCCGTVWRDGERVTSVMIIITIIMLHCCLCCVNLCLLLFFLIPSSISGFRVTMTTLTMRLLPPCLIILTTCLCPTLTTF